MAGRSLDIVPLTPTIGAEILGVDLSRPLGDDELGAIRAALAQHLVVFFRDQQLDPESHIRFGRYFGELGRSPIVEGAAGYPEIVRIHADAQSQYVAGEQWHSDLSCNPEPPMGSVLYLHTVPPVGGDTLFANMYAVYEALSAPMKRYLEGLSAVHDAAPFYRRIFGDTGKTYPSATHPIVRVHPVTGRPAIFVNGQYTTHIVGVPARESDAILAHLYECCADPSVQVRFRWRPHSVAFWDNRCAQHQAIWDYYPQLRSGNRISIKGDKPIGLRDTAAAG
ncbi:MAG: TauD/TfdA family dioxygenase [Rhodospirillaceae bacterium]|nr:TauD/TfdA family dioxygenase [Rhodospirillaceae bacterium]